MRVFQKQLAGGKKRIAIFYGAAHMPDFEQRLTKDFGLKRKSTGWHTAWDLRKTDDSAIEGVMKVLLQELSRELESASRAPKPRGDAPPKARKPAKTHRRII